MVGLDEPREHELAAAANFPCWLPLFRFCGLSCLRPRGAVGHLTAGGRGPRMTCNHPSGTSKVLHPLRGINGNGSQGPKKETPERTFGDTQKQCRSSLCTFGLSSRTFRALSRPQFRSFCLSLGVFSWFLIGVWKRRGCQMCTFWALRLYPGGFGATGRLKVQKWGFRG